MMASPSRNAFERQLGGVRQANEMRYRRLLDDQASLGLPDLLLLAHEQSPQAKFLKQRIQGEWRVVWKNAAYDRLYQTGPEQIGARDTESWEADDFGVNDEIVASDRSRRFIECARRRIVGGVMREVLVVKWPVRDAQGRCVAVAGMVITHWDMEHAHVDPRPVSDD